MTKPIGKLSQQDVDAIWIRARSLPLPKYISVPVIQDFLKWGESSGWEFAISRFKAMKTNLIRIYTGLEPIWETGQYPSKGISWFKGLVSLSKKGDGMFSICCSLLNVYTSLIFSEITPKQMDKFTSGVEAKPVNTSRRFIGALLNAASSLPVPKGVKKAKYLMDHQWSPDKRTPSTSVDKNGYLTHFVTRPEMGGVLDSALLLLSATRGAELTDLIEWSPDFEAVIDGLAMWQNRSIHEELAPENPATRNLTQGELLGGTISFIQEAGGKLRSVANPYRWWQVALNPLADSIHELLREIPWDCTHDQIKPVLTVQESLQSGDEWFSVDISSATDHFPLDYQISVLNFLYQNDTIALSQIRLFHTVSRLRWWFRDEQGKLKFTRYAKGQPMGLRPSFGSFALTHGLVLLALNQGKWEEDFFVLGDDVIIKGEKLHRQYRHFLQKHEIPVAESKTLHGGIAEFASLIVTPRTVVPIYKWRKTSSDNFVDLARLWGPGALRLFSKEEQKVLKKLALIPPCYGGLGWGDPTLWDYSVPKWIGTRVGQLHDPSNLSSYMKSVYTSESVSQMGLLPRPRQLPTDKSDLLTELVHRVTGVWVTNNAPFLRSMASNVVEQFDVFIPYADWDGKPLSKLDLWKHRLKLN